MKKGVVLLCFLVSIISTDYSVDGSFCDARVEEDSIISIAQSCPIDGIGGALRIVDRISLDCQGYSVTGDSLDNTNKYGIMANASHVVIKNCADVLEFGVNLNVSSNNATVINSKINDNPAGGGKDAWFNASINATFLNVTFTRANLEFDQPTDAPQGRLWTQYYLLVWVNDTNGDPVENAIVNFYNESGVASDLSATWKSSESTSNRDAKHIGEVLVGNAA